MIEVFARAPGVLSSQQDLNRDVKLFLNPVIINTPI